MKNSIALIGTLVLAHINKYSFRGNIKASINTYRSVTKQTPSVNRKVDFKLKLKFIVLFKYVMLEQKTYRTFSF